MRLRGDKDIRIITEAINGFSQAYHDNFFTVRRIGQKYIAEKHPTEATARELAYSIRPILEKWGAGRRKAPHLRDKRDFTAAFLSADLHDKLAWLTQFPINSLGFDGGRRLVNNDYNRETLEKFDTTLLDVIQELSNSLFKKNTNVTYPLKALLLISGLMPALDSKVRSGLGNAGFRGVDKRQFLIPKNIGSTDAKKLTRLPFILGQCWRECCEQIRGGIQQSEFKQLSQDAGRVFDVLLFMQAGKSLQTPTLLKLELEREPWYELK